MLTESQRKQLKSKLKKMIAESLYENDFNENMYLEKKSKKKSKNSDSDSKKKSFDDNEGDVKREAVMKWLDSAQQLHSVLAYKLWPDMPEDDARSLFSKKYRGHDAEDNEYSFDDEDINTLYNMQDRFLDKIS